LILTAVAESYITSKWFKGKELAFAMGIVTSISKASSVLCYNSYPVLFQASGGLAIPFWVGFFVCCFAVVCTILLILLTSYGDRRDREAKIVSLETSISNVDRLLKKQK
jgi:hypothetical protein